MNKIVLLRKSGRGMFIKPFDRKRAVSMSMKSKGGSTSLLLSDGLGTSGGSTELLLERGLGGSGLPTKTQLEMAKPAMNGVIKKLEALQMKSGTKKKNISFQI